MMKDKKLFLIEDTLRYKGNLQNCASKAGEPYSLFPGEVMQHNKLKGLQHAPTSRVCLSARGSFQEIKQRDGRRSARKVQFLCLPASAVWSLALLSVGLQLCHAADTHPMQFYDRSRPQSPSLAFSTSLHQLRCGGGFVGRVCVGQPMGPPVGGTRRGILPFSEMRRRVGTVMQLKPSDKVEGSDMAQKKNVVSGTGLFAKEVKADSTTVGADASTPLTSWLVVALLLGLNVHNQWTRALVYYLVSFKVGDSPEASKLYMNKDLGFGEEQYSLLASFGFTTLYTMASLVAGRAADKFNRATVITLAAALWSVSTAATALSNSFEAVLGLRAVTGVTQAFVGPQAYGLIASKFSGSGMATANSIYASGVYVGGALASLSILLDEKLGWRQTSLAAGALGLGLAAVSAIAIRDPRDQEPTPPPGLPAFGAQGQEKAGSGGVDVKGAVDALKTVLDNKFVQILFVATAFRFCAGYGIGVWKAPFYREAFPAFTNEFGIANAFVISGGGILSSLLGGFITDKFSPKDQRVALWVPAAGSLLAVPFWIATVKSDNFYTSIGMLFLEYIAAECWFGPVVASLYKAVPKEVQGTAQGLFTVLTAVGNIMPVLIGNLQKDYAISDVLAVSVSAAYVLSGLFFFLASSRMPEKQA